MAKRNIVVSGRVDEDEDEVLPGEAEEEEIDEQFKPTILRLDTEYTYLGTLYGPGDCLISDYETYESLRGAVDRKVDRERKEKQRMEAGLSAY